MFRFGLVHTVVSNKTDGLCIYLFPFNCLNGDLGNIVIGTDSMNVTINIFLEFSFLIVLVKAFAAKSVEEEEAELSQDAPKHSTSNP